MAEERSRQILTPTAWDSLLAMGPPFPWSVPFCLPLLPIFYHFLNLFSHHEINFFHIFGRVELRGLALPFSHFITSPTSLPLWSS